MRKFLLLIPVLAAIGLDTACTLNGWDGHNEGNPVAQWALQSDFKITLLVAYTLFWCGVILILPWWASPTVCCGVTFGHLLGAFSWHPTLWMAKIMVMAAGLMGLSITHYLISESKRH